VHGRANIAESDSVATDAVLAYSMASSLVTAFNPSLVSDANADGTAEFGLSTRLVER
jgi:hypothetical protein